MTLGTSRPLLCALSLLLTLISTNSAAATALDVRTDFGYDSNAFKLNDQVAQRRGMFTELDAGLDIKHPGSSGGTIALDLGVSARWFESGLSDGDEQRYSVRLRGDSGDRRDEHAFDWALRYWQQNSTFVSRFTGRVATFRGAAIGDRFDSSVGELRGTWHLPGGAYGRLALQGAVETKNYLNDYTALGLDRLDYDQFGLEPQYEIGDRADTLRIGLPLALRQYRDRRVSDITGASIPGTDLEYRYSGVDARYVHEFSRANALEWSGGYELRRDNGVGYRNRKRWNGGIVWTLRPAIKTRLSAGLEYSSRVFDRPVTGDPTIVDETPEKKGYTANIKYVQPFPGLTLKDLSLLAEAQWESFDNTRDVRFSYDRLEAFAGLRKVF